ncbi:unnamed protein product [Clavelina lepadiformis]|uniref:Uncharacterized protein n=1 Tax=Clavelina lepadiformis TaxID=159417 RepID=A0ABP0G9G0_CLALP
MIHWHPCNETCQSGNNGCFSSSYNEFNRSAADAPGNPGLFNNAVSSTLSFLITCPYTFRLTNATTDLLYQKHPQDSRLNTLPSVIS